MKIETTQFGEHITIDGYNGDIKLLDSRETILYLLHDLPQKLGMTILQEPSVLSAPDNGLKDPGGWTGFVIIAESHISIHTFPQRGFVSADIYTCKNGMDIPFIIEYFTQAFNLLDIETNFLKRGTRYPLNNLPIKYNMKNSTLTQFKNNMKHSTFIPTEKTGIYPDIVKSTFINTPPKLDDSELVMYYKKGDEIITNQIMQAWETPYMKELARIATSNGGNVLEVGYGMGIAAGFIQESKKIKTHSVIECHPVMIANAKSKFAEEIADGRFILLEGFWEDIVKDIPDNHFDGILFDSCPLDMEVEFFQFFPFFKEAFRILKADGVFTYFSDEPLEISESHIMELEKAGFRELDFRICKVEPTDNCLYWKHKTIIAPIIRK